LHICHLVQATQTELARVVEGWDGSSSSKVERLSTPLPASQRIVLFEEIATFRLERGGLAVQSHSFRGKIYLLSIIVSR
jgi:hypothetical protein